MMIASRLQRSGGGIIPDKGSDVNMGNFVNKSREVEEIANKREKDKTDRIQLGNSNQRSGSHSKETPLADPINAFHHPSGTWSG